MAGSKDMGTMWALLLSCVSEYCHITPTSLASHPWQIFNEGSEEKICVLEQIPVAGSGMEGASRRLRDDDICGLLFRS